MHHSGNGTLLAELLADPGRMKSDGIFQVTDSRYQLAKLTAGENLFFGWTDIDHIDAGNPPEFGNQPFHDNPVA